MTATLFIGNAKTQTMLHDFDRLRKAIREYDPEATEAAWANCERWVDCINPTATEELRRKRAATMNDPKEGD
ncbi:hypothetical protein [Thalassovita sp.]|uniref:hypothetical protein n=1 Tax=Thalassovita sp. TaxID=1979401 RepID=UPI002AB2E5C1|nr:hypothetical protein [Thalassovita sp.]